METQDEFKKTESMRVWAFQDGKLEMDHMDVPVFDHEQECFTGAGECDVPPYLVVMGYGAIALIGEEFYDACEATVLMRRRKQDEKKQLGLGRSESYFLEAKISFIFL